MTHTPGPWKHGIQSGEIYSVATGRHIATMNRNGMDSTPEWTLHDACLIAAVLELYEALEQFVRYADNGKHPELSTYLKTIAGQKMIAAIAKAEGR